MAGRRAARRTALVLLYQWDVTGQELASLYEGEIDPFSRELAEAVVARHEQLDRRITDGRRRVDRRPPRRARAQHPAHGDPRARPRRGAARGGDRRGGHAGQALLLGGRRRLVNGILGKIVQETA